MTDNLPAVRGEPGARAARERETLRKLKRYLLLRAQHELFHAACKQAGIAPETVKKHRRENPQFAEAEQAAVAEGVEQAEQILKEKALNGDYQSLSKYLEANDEKYAPKRADERHSVLIVPVNAGNIMERIAGLRDELERRAHDMPEMFRDSNPFLQPDEQTPGYEDADEIIDAEIVE